jgi:hypothetical protein
MTTARVNRHYRVTNSATVLALLLAMACVSAACAAPPINALPVPFFCFDADSPSVQAGLIDSADILDLGESHPQSVVSGPQLGLTSPDDSLAGLSSPHSDFTAHELFVILFSVDRATVGVANPDPELVAAGVPYNVRDQAWRGQAAGDQFISTARFTLAGGYQYGSFNSLLGRNNFDEGGTDFQAGPTTSASTAPLSDPEDNVICTAYLSTPKDEIEGVYFTAVGTSPSLQVLSSGHDNASGANVFYNSNPQSGGITRVYALYSALGLQRADNIDALVVVDVNVVGTYDASDAILFSLAPGSPSLSSISEASPVGAAADIFLARPGYSTSLFASAGRLGLGAATDNIDALELFSCAGDSYSPTESGIRALRGDLNCDDLVDILDITPFAMALASPSDYYSAFPGGDVVRADANQDGAVNALDIDAFVTILTEGH